MNDYLLPEGAYKVMKWLGLIALPAVAACVGTIGTACGWDATGLAVTVITAVGTLIGALIGVSTATAKPAGEDPVEGEHVRQG